MDNQFIEVHEQKLDQLAIDIGKKNTDLETSLSESLFHAASMGNLLLEAKYLLAHGQFGDWVNNNCPFSHSQANKYMKLARAYPSFMEENSSSTRNLSIDSIYTLLSATSEVQKTVMNKLEAGKEVSQRDLQKIKNSVTNSLDSEVTSKSPIYLKTNEIPENDVIEDSIDVDSEIKAINIIFENLECLLKRLENSTKPINEGSFESFVSRLGNYVQNFRSYIQGPFLDGSCSVIDDAVPTAGDFDELSYEKLKNDLTAVNSTFAELGRDLNVANPRKWKTGGIPAKYLAAIRKFLDRKNVI